jgi:hypothetical protein
MGLDVQKLINAQKAIQRMSAGIPLGGYTITPHALIETDERLFPVSKHRSKRIRKKLIKRFGGEFRKKPGAFRMGNQIFMHPAIYAELQRQTARTDRAVYVPELAGI